MGSEKASTAASILLVLSILANVAVFSDRAVFIDEHLFLNVARMPRESVIFASGEWLFFGNYAPLSAHTHSPFGEYILGLMFLIVGRFDEAIFRLIFASFFSIIAALSFYGLARRVSANPFLLTMLLVASPPFFVFSQTLMMDMPMLALMLAGLHWYLKGAEGATLWLVAAAVSFTGSVAFGYAALVPLVCLLAIALWLRRPGRELAVICAPIAALAGWGVALTIHYGQLPFLMTARHLAGGGSVIQNMLAAPSFVGGVTVFPWLLTFTEVVQGNRRALKVGAGCIVLALCLSFLLAWVSKMYVVWYIFLASAGIALAVRFFGQLSALLQTRRVLDAFSALGFPAVLLFFIFFGEFISARYLLLAIPPLYLAIFRHSDKRLLAVLLAATAALSIVIATADYRFVNTYRQWVSANIPSVQKDGFRVWNSGESGLRFYLEELGSESLSSTDLRPRSGDLIVRQKMFRYSLPEPIEIMLVPLKVFPMTDRFPLRTFNQVAGAGFHGSGFGLVPYLPSRALYDVLEIVEISPLAQAQPPAVYSEGGPILIQSEPEVSVPLTLPPNSRIEYDVDGHADVEIREGRVILRKNQADRIVWRNFRVVPASLANKP